MASAKTAGSIVLALCSLLLALAIGEGIVRVAGLGNAFLTRGALHEFDPEYGWRCLSGLDAYQVRPRSFEVRIRCNEAGMRGGPVALEKPAGVLRIAVLGDSFMWGYGVEDDEVFAHQLDTRFPDAQTLNLGGNGFGTVQQLVRLESQGLAYDPDWTIVAFFWNDLEDNFGDKDGGRPVARFDDSGALRVANRPVRRRWRSGPYQWIRQNSRLVAFVEYAAKLVGETTKTWFRPEREEDDDDFLPGSSDPGVMKFTERDVYAPPSREIEHAWEAVHRLLARIDTRQRERGGRTLVMYVPSKYAMDLERFRELFGADPDLDWNRPARRLGEIARDLGVAYLNLDPAFRAAPDPSTLFLDGDAHWNSAGHALAARLAAERIRAERDRDAPPAVSSAPES